MSDSWDHNEELRDELLVPILYDQVLDEEWSEMPEEDRAAVNAMIEEDRASNRRYAMTLAAIRQALHLTQVEMADRLGVPQPRISEFENRPDMLVSTLASYLGGIGLAPRLVVTIPGQGEVEVSLSALADNTQPSTTAA